MLGMGRLQIPEPCVLYSDWLDCFREVFPCSYQPFGTHCKASGSGRSDGLSVKWDLRFPYRFQRCGVVSVVLLGV